MWNLIPIEKRYPNVRESPPPTEIKDTRTLKKDNNYPKKDTDSPNFDKKDIWAKKGRYAFDWAGHIPSCNLQERSALKAEFP